MKNKSFFKIISAVVMIAALIAAFSLASHADGDFSVTITSVELESNGTKVAVNASIDPGFYAGHEGAEYALMELKAWNGTNIPADAKPVAVNKPDGEELTLTCGFDRKADRYDTFVVAIRDGGGYTALSLPHFVDGIGSLASNTSPEPVYPSKKGLASDDLGDVLLTGSSFTVVDIPVDELLLPGYQTDSEPFVFNGNTYYVRRSALQLLDQKIAVLNGAGVGVYARVYLSGAYRASAAATSSLYYSTAPDGASAYALNTASESAVGYYSAIMDFLAGRYASPSGEHGFICRWIAGAGADTFDTSSRGELTSDEFVESYQRTLRLTYTAVVSVWSEARVYVPVSNAWTAPASAGDLAVKSFLTSLASAVRIGGDIPWNVAISGMASDPSLVSVWTDSRASDSADAEFVTMKNISVLCDFLAGDGLLYNGSTRAVSVTGFAVNSSPDSPGDLEPSASFVYAFFKAQFNDSVDALIWSTARDDAIPVSDPAAEAGSGEQAAAEPDPAVDSGSASGEPPQPVAPARSYLGLYTEDGTRKTIYDVFTKIDAALIADQNYKTGDTAAFALSVVGAADWSIVAPGYDASAVDVRSLIEGMPIMASDIPSNVKTTSTVNFTGGIGTFYPAGADYVELRTSEGPNGTPSPMLYAGLPVNGGAHYSGVACPLVMSVGDVKYISFDIYVEAPLDVASVAVTVLVSGTDSVASQFIGSAAVKPNSWQSVAFRCEDLAKAVETTGGLTVLLSSYDGADHPGAWGVYLDNVVTTGAHKTSFVTMAIRLVIIAVVLVVLFFLVVLILRIRNTRRAKRRRSAQNENGQ